MTKILLIENDARLTYLYKAALSFQRFEIAVSETIGEAMNLPKTEWPSLVILDLNIPDSHHYKKNSPQIPIIILTSLEGGEAKREADEFNTKYYLNPLTDSLGSLIKMVRDLV